MAYYNPVYIEAVTFFSLGFSYTLPKINYDSYARQKAKFASPENYRLAYRGDISPFRSFKLNVRKGSCLLSGHEEQVITGQ
jgi:hypothetical protein